MRLQSTCRTIHSWLCTSAPVRLKAPATSGFSPAASACNDVREGAPPGLPGTVHTLSTPAALERSAQESTVCRALRFYCSALCKRQVLVYRVSRRSPRSGQHGVQQRPQRSRERVRCRWGGGGYCHAYEARWRHRRSSAARLPAGGWERAAKCACAPGEY